MVVEQKIGTRITEMHQAAQRAAYMARGMGKQHEVTEMLWSLIRAIDFATDADRLWPEDDLGMAGSIHGMQFGIIARVDKETGLILWSVHS